MQATAPNNTLMKAVLTVKDKTYLSPHYIRITLEGGVGIFKEANAGDNNKIVIPADKSVPLTLRDGPSAKGAASYDIRTYTMRSLDLEKDEMTIDFVAHGDEGPASHWAINAVKGDELGVLMKVKKKPLFKPAAHYTLLADHTALPVVSVMLEQLPKAAQGTAFIEVYSEEDVLTLEKPEGVSITWLVNAQPGVESELVKAFQGLYLTVHASQFVFAAAEFQAIKTIQEGLRAVDGLERSDWYAYSYWKHGKAENASAADRRELKNTAS